MHLRLPSVGAALRDATRAENLRTGEVRVPTNAAIRGKAEFPVAHRTSELDPTTDIATRGPRGRNDLRYDFVRQ
jgi:hypothetical protein